MSLARMVFRPAVRSVRSAHHSHSPNNGATLADMTKWKPQTPDSFVYDGYATARVPFRSRRPRLFTAGGTAFFAFAFWLPFLLVEYQLRKSNQ